MTLAGSCLCGAIRFASPGPVAAATACHCGQCRKLSGHIWSDADVPRDTLAITGTPRWYQSSAKVRRGFCPTCGAFLFWDAPSLPTIAISLGAIDGPTGLALESHIFTAQAADYAPLPDDGVPRR